MKFAIVVALLFTLTANAQKASPNADSAKAVVAPTQFTHADTVHALHNLFKSRRSTGGWLVRGSAFFTAFTGVGTLADYNGKNCGGYFCPDALGSALIIGIGTAPAWIPGSISLIRLNKKSEKSVIEEYEKTRKLPLYVQRRLAGRFYNTIYSLSKRN
ncbi:MAG: hypothetical protein NVS3B25_31340 [Hymenobacter sp.]